MEYCSVIWSPIYKNDAQEIEKVQRRATKLLANLKELSYSERLKELNLPTLAYRRKRADILQVYRIIHKIDKIPFEMFFSYNTRDTRGHKYKLDKPRANTALRQNSFSHRVIDTWNKLPQKVVEAPSINAFKNALEKAWKDDEIKYYFE